MLLDITEPGQVLKEKEVDIVVGIDLGTTNSLIAFASNGNVEIIGGILPSIVAYNGDDIVVGDISGKGLIKSVKRLIGRGISDVKNANNNLSFKIDDSSTEEIIYIDVGEKKVTPVEVSSEILKSLKSQAEDNLRQKVTKAVITVPAFFDDAARAATKDAARLAGIEVLRLINEPTAAAMAYGLDNAVEGIYAVYDLGGGTFDVSILKMQRGVFQVLSTNGETFLGGDDFDNLILDYYLLNNRLDGSIDVKNAGVLLSSARSAKEYLTENECYDGTLNINGKEVDCGITKDKLNELIKPLIDKTISIFRSALKDADIIPDALENIIMVGGSTRVPLVIDMIGEFIGKTPLTNLNPDEIVAIGAAIQAEALTFGAKTLLLDVTPLSLGIEIRGGIVENIIERNTPIPAQYSQKFTTSIDGQTTIKIHVLQGEREMVEKCRSLAEFELHNIPPMKAGGAVIEVTFNIDMDGLLSVSACEEITGVKQHIEVKPSYGLSADKMEQMLRDSMEHAREDIADRLLAESKIDAELSLNAIKTAMKEDTDLLDDSLKEKILQQVQLIKQLIAEEKRDAIDYEVKKLEKICSPFVEKRVNNSLSSMLEGKTVSSVEKKI